MAAGEVIRDIQPRLEIQQDTRACLSAAILTQLPEDSGVTEADISDLLAKDGIYEPGVGSSFFPADELDNSLRQLGLSATAVYDARGPVKNEEQQIVGRLGKIEAALRDGQSVLLAFPRQREGQPPFLHYSIATGFTETENGSGVVIVDPSDVDGDIRHPNWDELKNFVRPIEGLPVMAWGIGTAEEGLKISTKIADDGLPGFSLLAKPLYREEDTGLAIPTGTDYPVSVAMPTTDITEQFHDYGEIVLSRDGKLPTGYPRFVVPPAVKGLSRKVLSQANGLPFPSRQAAEAAAHQENVYGSGTAIQEAAGLFWLPDSKFNLESWQRTGLGISARQAVAVAEGWPENDLQRRAKAEAEIKQQIEHYTGAKPEDIYLFPTGMAAIYWLNQALIKLGGSAPAVQFGFPYTDTYGQRYFGPHRQPAENMIDMRNLDYDGLLELSEYGDRKLRSVMTEFPSNPLLRTPDFERLNDIVADKTPVVVDDTVGTMMNLEDAALPPSVVARVTSLTKFFSSAGDVMGGSVVLRPDSPHYTDLKTVLDALYEDTLWYEDAEALARGSRLFPKFMAAINRNGAELADWLDNEWTQTHQPLEAVFHPSLVDRVMYHRLRKPDGGYGGLMSLRFKEPERGYRFFDKLRVTKGPSLGTYYTLGCLYTLLAHKSHEGVEDFGLSNDLVRISVGIEDIDDLKARFEQAIIESR